MKNKSGTIENWEIEKLSVLFEIKPPKKEALIRLSENDMISFVPMKDLGIQTKDLSAKRERRLKEVYSGYTYFQDNDVLLAKITPCFENGKVGIARNLKNGVGFGSSEYIVFRSMGKIEPDYLYYYLICDQFKENGKKRMTGAVGHKRVPKDFVENQKISYPVSLLEQKRIISILDKVFEKIEKAKENAEKNLQNARELFESYLQGVFVNHNKKLEEKKLGEICDMINRGVSPKYIEHNGLCVLNQKCIRNHKINFDLARIHDYANKKVSRDKYIQIGDVLVNSTGTGTLGRVAQVRDLSIIATVDSHITIVRPLQNMFFAPFFGYAMIFIEKEIAKRGEGCGGQTELARNTLKNEFKISFPKSLSEQRTIVAKLDILSEQTKKLEALYKQKLVSLDELKKSVLQKTFNGEL